MSKNVKELREERGKIVFEMQKMATAIGAEDRNYTAEENEKFEKMEADESRLRSTIERIEKTEKLTDELHAVQSTGIGREDKVITTSLVKPEEQELAAFRSMLMHGNGGVSVAERQYLRSLGSSGAGSAGAYVAPALPTEQLEKILRDLSGVLSAPVRKYPTNSGNTIPWPSVDDTGNSASQVDENPASAIPSTQDPTFGVKNIGAFTFSSEVQKVSRQWLQDSIVPAEELVNELLGERLAAKLNVDLTTGNGSTTAEGIITGASASSVSLPVATLGATATAMYQNVQSMIHSIAPQYRKSPSFGLMFNDSTLLEYKKVVDSTGRPLWNASMASGEPDRLCNVPYYINADMPSIGSNNKSIVVGDFSKFIVRTVRQIEFARIDELYIEKLQVGFICWYRMDSAVINSNAIKYVKHATS